MAVINDSVGNSEVLFEVDNQGVDRINVLGNGTVRLRGTNTIQDSNNLNRAIFNSTAKTIVDGSTTDLFSLTLPASSIAGGFIAFLVEARDASNTQALSGIATYSAVATSGGTVTGTITYATANEAKTLSSGTLTLAFSVNVSSSVATFRIQPTGSLTETTYNIRYTLLPLQGAVTIL